jgi:hypothetical protein
MRYNFSAEFLLTKAPDSTFAQAWESLCATLIREEFSAEGVLRLRAPDTGIDILHRPRRDAYQCKSNVLGSLGTIDASSSVRSLKTACPHRHRLGWDTYLFAANAPFSGVAVAKIMQAASRCGLSQDDIVFRGPDYWDALCGAHSSAIEDRFDYKVSLSQMQLLEALCEYVENSLRQRPPDQELAEYVNSGGVPIDIRNSLTKLVVQVLLSPKMRVEQLVGALLHLLKISDLHYGSGREGCFLSPETLLKANGQVVFPSTRLEQLLESGRPELCLWLSPISENESALQERIWATGRSLVQSSPAALQSCLAA